MAVLYVLDGALIMFGLISFASHDFALSVLFGACALALTLLICFLHTIKQEEEL